MIDQLLHGYNSGHRLLAKSPGVTREESDMVDRYSDASGYAPYGYRWHHMMVGYPVGTRYALSAIWPDSECHRGGAVLTHTLILPRRILTYPLQSLAIMLRQPTRHDWPTFCAAIEEDGLRVFSSPAPPPSAVTVAAFPVVCLMSHTSADDLVFSVWETLTQEQRASFSFHTDLFTAITLPGGRPFDLSCIRPASRGAFSKHKILSL